MDIPGIATTHCVITDNCRKMRGNEGAIDYSIDLIKKDYLEIVQNRQHEKGLNYRVVLLIEEGPDYER